MAQLLLREVLPQLAEELATQLEGEDEPQLANQVPSLRIVDRCRCGDDFCATFYTAPKPKGAYGEGHETIALELENGYLNVDVVSGRIVCVEVLYRDDIRDKLLRRLP